MFLVAMPPLLVHAGRREQIRSRVSNALLQPVHVRYMVGPLCAPLEAALPPALVFWIVDQEVLPVLLIARYHYKLIVLLLPCPFCMQIIIDRQPCM